MLRYLTRGFLDKRAGERKLLGSTEMAEEGGGVVELLLDTTGSRK